MEDTIDNAANETLRRQNEDVLKQLNPGDLIKFDRGLYEHWVVYIGDEEGVQKVIHLRTEKGPAPTAEDCKACIAIDPFWDFAGTSRAENGNKKDIEEGIIDGSKVTEGAKAIKNRTEKDNISGLFDNCEHFAKWCRYGHLAQLRSVEEIVKLEDLSSFICDRMTNNNIADDKIKEHNTQLLHTLKEGDLIKFSRTFYYHWAVYIGKHEEIENAIIHWSSPADYKTSKKASITITSFWKTANGDKADKGNDNETRNIDGSDVVRRAKVRHRLVTKEQIINKKYNILFNNCQHFAKWCRYGPDEISEDQTSSRCHPEEDLNIEDPKTRIAILELKKKWETDARELKEEVKQLRTEIRNLQQGILKRDYALGVLMVLCLLSFYRGRK